LSFASKFGALSPTVNVFMYFYFRISKIRKC
jgi:hypothetical protein